MEENTSVTGSWVSIQEAATQKGVSPDTIRNWIKSKKVMSRKVEIDQGFKYEVFLTDYQVLEIVPPSSNLVPRTEVDLTPLAELTRELVNRVGQLERENGSLSAKLQEAESQLLLLGEVRKKPWWKIWS